MHGDTGLQQQWDNYRRAHNTYEQGIAEQEHGDEAAATHSFEQADALFQLVLKQAPGRPEIYAIQGDMLIRRGRAPGAYFLLSRQIQKGVSDPAMKWQLARALLLMKQTRKALVTAQEVAAAQKDNLKAAAFIGECASELGEDPVAIVQLSRVLDAGHRRGPTGQRDEEKWRRLLALSLSRVGRHAEALAMLEALVKEQPQNSIAKQDLATVLCQAPGQALRGIALLEQLQREHPMDPAISLALGGALLYRGQAAAAVPLLRTSVAALPDDRRAKVLLGRALNATGHGREALDVLQRAEDDGEALWEIGRIYLFGQPQDLAAAEPALFRATTLLPTRAEVCVDHGTALLRLGRAPKALEEAQRCQHIEATHPRVLLLLARAYQANARIEESIATYRLALARQADPATLGELAQVLLRHGLFLLPANSGGEHATATLADLQEAYRLQPSPVAARALALGQIAVKKPDEAVRFLRPMAELREADPQTLGAYGRALREAGKAQEALIVFRRGIDLKDAKGRLRADAALSGALRAEILATLVQLKRAGEACSQQERADDEAQQRLVAVACLSAARSELESTTGSAKTALGHLQGALRWQKRLSDGERVETELLQGIALVYSGQFDQGLRRLQALETEPGKAALLALLGPGGFDEVLTRAALRAGQIQIATQRGQRAIGLLPKAEALKLQTVLAEAYVTRAISAYERNDFERAFGLLKSPAVQAEAARKPGIIAYDLGAVLLARGKPEEAMAQWGRLDPKEVPEKWIALGAYHDAGGDWRAALEDYRRFLQHTPTGAIADRVRHWVDVIQRFEGGGKSQSQGGGDAGGDVAAGEKNRPVTAEQSRTAARRAGKLAPHAPRPPENAR